MKKTQNVGNFTKEQLLELKENSSKLRKDVINWILSRYDDYSDKENILLEVIEHGCVSGIVSELIYYTDTVSFYYKHKEEIRAKVYKLMDETGIYSPNELFKDWDKTDPLVIETHNQNLLAWFGFEDEITILHNHFFWGFEL